MTHYNYVFIYGDSPWIEIAYSDIVKRDDVHVTARLRPSNPLLAFLYRLHHNPRVNALFQLPFHNLWFKGYYDPQFKDPSRPICFLIDARRMQYGFMHEFVDYLHRYYPDCRIAAYYFDLVRTYLPLAKPEVLRNALDLLVSYDKADAVANGMEYHPTSFSDYAPGSPLGAPSDVYFLGLAKNRLSAIYRCYDQLVAAGLTCDFYIIGVPQSEQRTATGLHYIKAMSYQDNLRHVLSAKSILEIQQQGATGPTLRTWEAVNYGRMLLTDNACLRDTAWYSQDYVSLIEDGTVDCEAVRRYVVHDNPLRRAIRPGRLIEFIDNALTASAV